MSNHHNEGQGLVEFVLIRIFVALVVAVVVLLIASHVGSFSSRLLLGIRSI